jgi:hypothetical protein
LKRGYDLKVPGQVVRRIEVRAESDRLRGIRVTFTDGTHRLAGKAKGAL